MRILHVTPSYGDAPAYGGVPRAVAALVRAQRARGHDVTVATTDAWQEASRRPPALEDGGPRLRVFRNLSNVVACRWQFYLPRGLRRWLARHAGEFQVAHLHAFHNLPVSLAARALARAGVPYLLQPHGTAPLLERRRLAKWAFDRTLGRGTLEGASLWLAVSEAERAQLAALGLPPARLRVVPAPVDLSEFAGVFPEPRPSGPRVVWLGRLSPRKRVDLLVDAFADFVRPDARLVIAGPDAGCGPSLRWQVRARGLARRVEFRGALAGPERLRLLASADVVAYPSRDEVLGLVALEAILCGSPVVVADDCGAGEVVRRLGGGRVFPEGDAAALGRAIDDLLSDPPAARALARTSQEAVRKRFSADAIAARLDDVLAEVAA